jgi:hypothetical protein
MDRQRLLLSHAEAVKRLHGSAATAAVVVCSSDGEMVTEVQRMLKVTRCRRLLPLLRPPLLSPPSSASPPAASISPDQSRPASSSERRCGAQKAEERRQTDEQDAPSCCCCSALPAADADSSCYTAE